MKSLIYILFLAVVFFGCSKDKNDSVVSSNQTEALTSVPGDQSVDVKLNQTIQLSFAKPVDRNTVEKNFHLISENTIENLTYPGMGGMGGMMHESMGMVMMDSAKMDYLDHYGSTHGKFSWNSDSTICYFKPDSLMLPNTQYMMHFGTKMMQMMNNVMGNMMSGGMMGNGMMNGWGTGEMTGNMMWHFTTTDTTNPSGYR